MEFLIDFGVTSFSICSIYPQIAINMQAKVSVLNLRLLYEYYSFSFSFLILMKLFFIFLCRDDDDEPEEWNIALVQVQGYYWMEICPPEISKFRGIVFSFFKIKIFF